MNREKESQESITQRLQSTADFQKTQGGFNGKITVSITENPRLSARTSMQTKETCIDYAKSYSTEHHDRVHAFVNDAAAHEINHHRYNGIHRGQEFRGCPRNTDLATRLIFEPILEVFKRKKFSEADALYAENALEDLVLQSDLSPVFSLNGISYFFEEVGQSSPKHKFTPFYDANVRLNLMLWGNKQQKRRLKPYFTEDSEEVKKIKSTLETFLQESGLKTIDASFSVDKNPKIMEERQMIREYIINEENWPRIARAYANAFSQLITKSYALPLLNHKGAGTKGREKEDSSNEGNEFQKERMQRPFKMGRIQEAHAKQQGAPIWIDSFEAMDLLYEGFAKELAFEARTFTESERMPILYYGQRRFNTSSDSMKNITFGFDANGQLELRKRPYAIDMQFPVKESTYGFPDSKFVLLDTSESMSEDFYGKKDIGSTAIVPWGDRSKYHAAMVEWYGFVEWLKSNHLLERLGIDMVNFSNETNIGRGLEQAKKIALRPQFGETMLDISKVQYIFSGKDHFIMTISDGQIQNWDSIRSAFLQGVKDNYYVHLQLGSETKATLDINAAGGHVENISSPEELMGRTVVLADKFYRDYRR